LGEIPVAPEAAAEAGASNMSPQQFAAEGGEDFELLVALPPEFNGAALFAKECGIPLTRIGSVLDGHRVRFVHDGRTITLKGFNHFG